MASVGETEKLKDEQLEDHEERYLDPVSDGGGNDVNDFKFKIRLKRVGNLINQINEMYIVKPQENLPDHNLDICVGQRVIFRRGPNFPDVREAIFEESKKERTQINVYLLKSEPGMWKSLFLKMR